MASIDEYIVPDIWTWNEENGGTFGSINRPVAGATFDSELPVGKHPLQLYSEGTPNGVKVTILLEELLAAGHQSAEYDAWLIKIGKGEQFSSGFVEAKYCWSECDINESIASFKKMINKNTCAVLVEPIQGEAGIRVPQDGWLLKLRELCTSNNVLLILDEIQSGLGRTGKLFAYQHENIKPDGLILGKALGGAMLPISAFLSSKEVMDHFNAGSHGSTFGGNPLATKVASRALELLYEDNLIENSHILGDYFKSKLKSIDNKIIKDVRGKGLWIGMELNESEVNAKDLCLMLLNEGLLCKETHKTVIRFAPPLMITKEQLDWAIKKITKVIRSI